ncbi:hypothetical protein D3C80_1007970 [compost metagenome]
MADQHGTGDGNAHQGIDIEIAILQGDPALFIGAQAPTANRHQGDQRHHPGWRKLSEVNDFRSHCRHAGQRQRPPVLFRSRCRCIRCLAFDNRLGLHAERRNCRFDRRGVGQGMAHAEDAVDQVEFQLFDAGELGQLVLDQGLFGRAIHGFDAKTAQARAGTRGFGQLDERRRLGP